MSRHYSDPLREANPWSLPDAEIFRWTEGEMRLCPQCGARHPFDEGLGCHECGAETDPSDEGFYFWFCLPGCLPDSEPDGPYATEQAALDAARELAGD